MSGEFMCKSCGHTHPERELGETITASGSTYKICKKAVRERIPGNIEAIKAVGEVVEVEAQWTETEQECPHCHNIDKLTPVGFKMGCESCAEAFMDRKLKAFKTRPTKAIRKEPFRSKQDQDDYMVAFGEQNQGRGIETEKHNGSG